MAGRRANSMSPTHRSVTAPPINSSIPLTDSITIVMTGKELRVTTMLATPENLSNSEAA
ncbi:MAG: hypothetical protein ACOCTT_00090 [archaeon]